MGSDGPGRKEKPAAVLFGALPAELKPSAAEKRQLAVFANTLSARVADGREFTCLIADDRELLRLNYAFLGHEYPTDVLSFPSQAEPSQTESATSAASDIGEIAISIERAAAQAHEFGHAPFDELRILMLHGLLHLIGLDHEKDNGEMALAEQRWRSEFQLPQTLIARIRRLHAHKTHRGVQSL
ncbi:MAG TPA: rRNA maturation RNase YbeY [Bryobacteraceae bacterium]|nr:rRNA maturation RNase YbeY [Bryobacteraceae bacterium]